jgi:multicomponent K+:H+ antiporter subunit D
VSTFWEQLMTHWATFPLLIPLVGAFVTPLWGQERIDTRRSFSVGVLFLTAAASVYALLQAAGSAQPFVYGVGGWQPPFGIVLVVDRLSAVMVTMTSLLGLGAHLYAMFGDDERRNYFHFLLLVQIAGINGAFLTGDLFNLFVFFEILLIASYNLLMYGGGERRAKAGIHYVVINLVGSSLFLIAVGVLYALTGTLNMADMALQVAQLPAEDAALARSAATMLTLVFGIKAALLPLYFWLPRAYSAATASAAALFAVMTKVGIYAILRTSTIIFGDAGGVVADITGGWLIPLSLVTLVMGVFGVLAARRLRVLIAYLVIVSVGTILAPVALRTPEAIAASLYYLVHSTFVTALLFVLADMIADRRGEVGDSLVEGPAIATPSWLGLIFFGSAITVAGLPPMSGFLGKLMILDGVVTSGWAPWIWGAVLGGGLLVIVAFARAGSRLFWQTEESVARSPLERSGRSVAALYFLGLLVGWTVFAGPAYTLMQQTAAQTLDRETYIETVSPQEKLPIPDKKKAKGDGHH